MLKDMLAERQSSPNREGTDFFDYVVDELKKERSIMTESIALDLMFVLLFASFETTSLALTLAVKLLSDHPKVVEELTVSRILLGFKPQSMLSIYLATILQSSSIFFRWSMKPL